MPKSSSAGWLAKAIHEAARSARFCTAGALSVVDPGLEVEGLGAIRLPLKGARARALIERCRIAPYGKGTSTLVDTSVRKTFELDPSAFRLSDAWGAAIVRATREAAAQLGLPPDQLTAHLYKLLVYERGGFFLPHRDSEKHDGMVASMIVVLPNPFDGGTLVVRHGSERQTLDFAEARAGKQPSYAAFYADCEHEVSRVRRGVRLCLAYNLVLDPAAAGDRGAPHASQALGAAIQAWVAKHPTEPLVFALSHQYTQRGLALDLLKGTDRRLAAEVVPAAHDVDCLVYFAQVERHLVQDAHDQSDEWYGGRYGGRYGSWDDEGEDEEEQDSVADELEIGDTIVEDLCATAWVDPGGTEQPFGTLPLKPWAIVCAEPLDEWKPTREEYEGYTGNAGNTLDRWYHRSALVVWHDRHHFDVITGAGSEQSIPLFASMTAKLAGTPKTELAEARSDCIRLARAIIERWTNRLPRWHASETKSACDEFPRHLLRLHDQETVARFLARLAGCDRATRLTSFVPAVGREFGWKTFARELLQLLSQKAEQAYDDQLPLRDLEWLAAVCSDESDDADRSVVARKLCTAAVNRFCTPRQPRYGGNDDSKRGARSLELLLQALASAGCEAELGQVIDFVRKTPDSFDLDRCQVPVVEQLAGWSRERLGAVPAPIVKWWAALREQLEQATAVAPTPYGDWARPARVKCQCRYCAQLNAFLGDRQQATTRIAAPEGDRAHLEHEISRAQCDVKTRLDRQGRPYSLVLTKTSTSYERAVERFEADRALLKRLQDLAPSLPGNRKAAVKASPRASTRRRRGLSGPKPE